ncbi:MAG: glycoside hydrolase family 5 protein, partial [Chloroflexota bacterium]|nr:glycoside hydrolase family 5 protein [Chloroflexota bacterium]
LRVQGNRLVDGAGEPVRLLGVNRSGTEYACIQGWGIFDGPVDAPAIAAMKSWRINAVRVPLNEQCWLGINGVKPEYGAANYQAAIRVWVNALNAAGLAVILDLHWAAPASQRATEQAPMPNRDHSVEFWRQVAAAYKDNGSVVFDLYNEPIPDNNRDTAEAWRCWRDGGTCPGVPYQVAGMQELVNAVRGAGATNVIMLGGVQYGARLSQWLAHKPDDPTGNLAASWHMYNFSWCKEQSCWDAEVAPVAARVPVIAGEIGEDDCATAFIERLMTWLDARGGSYLGWTWNPWNCGQGGPALITGYDGTPTPYGQGFKDHLARVAAPAR